LALESLWARQVPFLIGGRLAVTWYTGIQHPANDLDVMVRPKDCTRALDVIASAGFQTTLPFKHWLGKARRGDYVVDVIFNSGNGVALVDDDWFKHACMGELFGLPLPVCSPVELIWSKAFVMERERFDGADIMHLIRCCGDDLDWRRLIDRFDRHWRVLHSHLVIFGFVYPGARSLIPEWVMTDLTQQLLTESAERPKADHICRGTLLSREQYLVDIDRWGYADARRRPWGNMTRDETEQWTAAIHRPDL
jgi:hypothetical protein